MLEIVGLKKRLENFTLSVEELRIGREYFVFLGLSGAGKTTLLEIIAGFRKADEGKILLNGVDITEKPINERKIVMCHGRYLFPHMSVFDNIAYGFGKKESRKEKVKEVAEMIGIEHLLDRRPETLSMGEQQRVALARALAVNPEVVLLDEPLNSLDRLTHENLLIELRRIHRKTGITFVHVTHDFVEAIALADRMAILKDGVIEQCGEVEDILRNPKNEFVARFVGVKNLISGTLRKENGHCIFENGKITLKLNRKVGGKRLKVGIRPEDVLIISNSNCRLSRENVFDAVVVDVYPVTLSTVGVLLDVNGVEIVSEVIRSKAIMMGLKRGKRVKVCITDVIPVDECWRC